MYAEQSVATTTPAQADRSPTLDEALAEVTTVQRRDPQSRSGKLLLLEVPLRDATVLELRHLARQALRNELTGWAVTSNRWVRRCAGLVLRSRGEAV